MTGHINRLSVTSSSDIYGRKMTAYSKQLVTELGNIYNCRETIHPWGKNCKQGNWIFFLSSLIGGMKFFSIMYAAQFLLFNRQVKKQDIPEILKSFMRSMAAAGSLAVMYSGTICTYGLINQKLSYNLLCYWAPIFSSFPIFLDHPLRRSLVCRSWMTMAIECVLRNLKEMTNFQNKEILFFMFCNAIFMHKVRILKTKNKKIPAMWFFKPPKLKEGSDKFCPHEKSCTQDIFQDLVKCFTFGLGFSLLKEIFKNPRIVKTPLNLLKALMSWNNLKIPSFASSYVGIYKILSCFICNLNKKDDTKYALLCGFISGIAFKLTPNLTILSNLILILIYIIGSELKNKFNLPDLHYEEFGFMISNTILLGTRFVNEGVVPTSFIKIIDMITNNKAAELYANFNELVRKYKEKNNLE